MGRGAAPPPGQGYDAPFKPSNAGMDPMLLGSVGILFIALSFIVWRLLKLKWDEEAAKKRAEAMRAMMEGDQRQQPGAANVAGGRRRNVRRRVNHEDDGNDFFDHMIQQEGGDEGNEYNDEEYFDENQPAGKVGKKKAEKLAKKEEKKAMREYEMHEREERKRREAEKEKKRDEEREKERLEEEAEEERLKKEKEEKERKEEEEYQKMKSAFAVEEEGFDEVEGEEAENLLRNFLDYVKNTKVVNIDELAAQFRLKSAQAVERIQHFLDNGDLQGVMDDRGKFICITEDELQAVAKFINQRGRVRINELVDQSNKLIRLQASN